MVAKSFQKMEITCEPYEKNGKEYVKVKTSTGSIREVRWYSDYEYQKMYPGEAIDHSHDPFYRTQRETLGFENGYITIFKGDTYNAKDWFKEKGARYTRYWGWGFGSTVEVPEVLPAGITPMRLDWSLVGHGDELKPESQVKEAVESLLYDKDPSQYVGEVGDKLELELTVKTALQLDGFYGPSTMHIMMDKNKNVFVWTTASCTLNVGEVYKVKGTVKDHKIYKHTKQTILTRCKCQEVEAEWEE